MEYDLLKRAKLRCMHLLEKRDYTEQQLREKLRTGKTEYPGDVIDAAVEYVKGYHYVDDARYALQYVECMRQRKSRRQIWQELVQKGVAREYIDAAFEQCGEIDEEEQIREWLRKKHFSIQESDINDMRKMYAFLSRKGFQSENIRRVLKVSE